MSSFERTILRNDVGYLMEPVWQEGPLAYVSGKLGTQPCSLQETLLALGCVVRIWVFSRKLCRAGT